MRARDRFLPEGRGQGVAWRALELALLDDKYCYQATRVSSNCTQGLNPPGASWRNRSSVGYSTGIPGARSRSN